jgi:hypothetical protein
LDQESKIGESNADLAQNFLLRLNILPVENTRLLPELPRGVCRTGVEEHPRESLRSSCFCNESASTAPLRAPLRPDEFRPAVIEKSPSSVRAFSFPPDPIPDLQSARSVLYQLGNFVIVTITIE